MNKNKAESNLVRFCDWSPKTLEITRMPAEELVLLRKKLGLPDRYHISIPASKLTRPGGKEQSD